MKLLASDEAPDVVRTVRVALAAAWPSAYLASVVAPGAAAAKGALCRISAREKLNLGGHALFFRAYLSIRRGSSLGTHRV